MTRKLQNAGYLLLECVLQLNFVHSSAVRSMRPMLTGNFTET
jgi:hypothetical protein